MNKGRIFLSGRIDGISLEESSNWREEATKIFNAAGYETYNPTKRMKEVKSYLGIPNEVYTNDTYYLSLSNVVLVNLELPELVKIDSAPFFTIGEMFLAHKAGKPIITFGNSFKGRPGYEAIITRNFPTMKPAIDYIINMY